MLPAVVWRAPLHDESWRRVDAALRGAVATAQENGTDAAPHATRMTSDLRCLVKSLMSDGRVADTSLVLLPLKFSVYLFAILTLCFLRTKIDKKN